MGSSIPAGLDYLATQVRALPEAAAPVVVSDGWPASRGDAMVALGITPEEDDSGVTVAYAELSDLETENVEIPCIVAVRRNGTNAASLARTAAFGLYDAINGLIRSDRRLGGAVRPGLPARVAQYQVSQTADQREAGDGRWCEIRFTIAWRHRG
jgi:hypothetical protein